MNDPTVSTQADGLPAGPRNRALLALSAAMFLAVLDAFIANNALPTIATQLAATPSQTIWVANAYQLAMTVSLLPFSSLGDIGGYRRVYLFGLLVFTLASLACGLADTLPMLVLARAGQGFGAAGVVSVNMALVRFIYPRKKLGQGMGIIGLVVAAAATSGPSITSAVLAVGPWHYLFLLNVPLGLLTLMLAMRYVPATQGTGHRFDIWGALLNGLGFGSMFIGLDGLGQGRDTSASLIECAAGILTLTIFIRRQLSVAAPMMPVDLFRFRPFAISAAASICANACVTSAFIALPFYFQYAGGWSQIETGLLMTPWPAALVVSAPVAGRLSDKYSAGILCGGGLAALVLGMLLLMQISPESQWGYVVAPMLICGVGFGFFQSSNNREFMVSAPPERSGACAGMMTTSRLIGQSIGGLIAAAAFAIHGIGRGGVTSGALLTLGAGVGLALLSTGISLMPRRAFHLKTNPGTL